MAVFVACIFVLLNIPLGLIGLALTGAGVCLQLSDSVMKPYIDPLLKQLPIPSGYTANIASYLQPAAIAFIVIGAIFALLAIMACIGLCCRRNGAGVCFFVIYAIFTTIFLLIFIALTALIGAPQQLVGSQLNNYMNSTLVNQYVAVDSTDPVNIVWNVAQLGLQCCGTSGGIDYAYAIKFNRTWLTMPDPATLGSTTLKLVIPASCCTNELLSLQNVISGSVSDVMKNPLAVKQCVFDTSPKFSNYANGCYNALFAKYYQYQWFCLGPAIAICLILLFLVVVPIVFACKSRNERKVEAEQTAAIQEAIKLNKINDYNNYK